VFVIPLSRIVYNTAYCYYYYYHTHLMPTTDRFSQSANVKPTAKYHGSGSGDKQNFEIYADNLHPAPVR